MFLIPARWTWDVLYCWDRLSAGFADVLRQIFLVLWPKTPRIFLDFFSRSLKILQNLANRTYSNCQDLGKKYQKFKNCLGKKTMTPSTMQTRQKISLSTEKQILEYKFYDTICCSKELPPCSTPCLIISRTNYSMEIWRKKWEICISRSVTWKETYWQESQKQRWADFSFKWVSNVYWWIILVF